ncbi:quinone-interacting membrane-bound oxidoreductase complex subunit QmoC [Bacteroidota bacterium]
MEAVLLCDNSPEKDPYPRKEIMWASWGLKDKLIGDPDIWLCHNCGDCTSSCPRDVRPGDVIASIRTYSYLFYARPRFLAKWLHSPKYLPLIILFPALIICGIISIAGTFNIPDGPVNYSNFFPHAWLNGSFSVIVLITVLFTLSGIRKFITDMRRNTKHLTSENKKNAFSIFMKIFKHSDFRNCNTNRFRSTAHLLVFWGFGLLLLVTSFAILAVIFFDYPMNFLHPVKIAGNVGGLALIIGCTIMIVQKLKDKNNSKGNTGYTEWLFLISLLLLTLSGIFVEMARFQNWDIAYHLYFIHLVLVWMVVIYVPYSKFAHIIFRTIAMVYTGNKGR